MNPLITTAAAVFGLDPAELVGPRRARHLVAARAGAAWAMRRRYPDMPLVAIACALGRSDHTTASNLIGYAEDRASVDQGYARRLRAIVERPMFSTSVFLDGFNVDELPAMLGIPRSTAEARIIATIEQKIAAAQRADGRAAEATNDSLHQAATEHAAHMREIARQLGYAVLVYREEGQHG